jgi:AcrR family transcriptional regulator
MNNRGRAHQRARTRNALIDGARQLLAEGVTPTVEQVASATTISRATAYRYFPNQTALLVASYPEIGESSLLGEHPPADAEARLEIVA